MQLIFKCSAHRLHIQRFGCCSCFLYELNAQLDSCCCRKSSALRSLLLWLMMQRYRKDLQPIWVAPAQIMSWGKYRTDSIKPLVDYLMLCLDVLVECCTTIEAKMIHRDLLMGKISQRRGSYTYSLWQNTLNSALGNENIYPWNSCFDWHTVTSDCSFVFLTQKKLSATNHITTFNLCCVSATMTQINPTLCCLSFYFTLLAWKPFSNAHK